MRAKRVMIWKVFMVLVTILIYFVLICCEGCGCQSVQMLMMQPRYSFLFLDRAELREVPRCVRMKHFARYFTR